MYTFYAFVAFHVSLSWHHLMISKGITYLWWKCVNYNVCRECVKNELIVHLWYIYMYTCMFNYVSHPSLGWLYDFSSFPPSRPRPPAAAAAAAATADFCFSRQNCLSFTLYIWDKESIGLGKCTGWPFGDLDPRSRLWHWLIKICLSAG